MASESQSSSFRPPLKRVRPDNENQQAIFSSKELSNKKLCRQSSEDSAFSEIEKSSDERAFDLFHKEYFSQFRPYFKHRATVRQLVEHLWINMNESSKVAFVKKILKDQGNSHLSTIHLNRTDLFPNNENHCEITRTTLNQIKENVFVPLMNHKYSRTFLTEFLNYIKHSTPHRYNDQNCSLASIPPLRRSSRVRRAPTKCVCSACTINRSSSHRDSSSSSSSIATHDFQEKQFRQLIDHYLQVDDQIIDSSDEKLSTLTEFQSTTNDSLNDSQMERTLSEIVESTSNTESSFSSILPLASADHENYSLSSSIDFLMDFSSSSNEKTAHSGTNKVISEAEPIRRTYVIITELDEPFFGPYPIEFTITI